jgi:hypothetical protein
MIEEFLNIHFNDNGMFAAPVDGAVDTTQGLVSRSIRPKPKAVSVEARLINSLQYLSHQRLHDLVFETSYCEGSCTSRWLRDSDLARWTWTPTTSTDFILELFDIGAKISTVLRFCDVVDSDGFGSI